MTATAFDIAITYSYSGHISGQFDSFAAEQTFIDACKTRGFDPLAVTAFWRHAVGFSTDDCFEDKDGAQLEGYAHELALCYIIAERAALNASGIEGDSITLEVSIAKR